MPSLTAVARSDVGRVRENNEDMFVCRDHLVAVADGMGGPPGGEVAAGLAIAVLDAAFVGRSLEELEAVVRAANTAITERARTAPELEGMGTTLCAAGMTADGNISVVNVGDSRAYLVREGDIHQLTDDHTVTAELFRRGELAEADVAVHPHRSVLTRVLGGGPTVDVDNAAHQPRLGDRLLLCTDGLFNEVSIEEFRSILETSQDNRALVESLIELALAKGGNDNVTVVVAEIST